MPPKRGTKRASNSGSKEGTSKTQKTDSSNGKKDRSNKNPSEIVKKLLSDEIGKLAFPEIPVGHGEIDWPAGEGKKSPPSSGAGKAAAKKESGKVRNYTSADLSPFEQLICSILLSKPISHKLGLRSIQTLLSPPYSLTTPKAMANVGFEGRKEALWEARTQHKEKTATQLGNLVDGIRKLSGNDDEDAAIHLIAVQKEAERAKSHAEAIDKTRQLLTTNIKGLGPTGVDIFLRMVQKQPDWKCVFPFADDRALKLAIRYGLVEESKDSEKGAKELAKLVDDDPKKFVKLLDVLIGIDLEKKTEEVLETVSS